MLSSADTQGFALDAAVIAARGSRRQPAPVSKSRKNLKRGEASEGTLKARFSIEGEMWRLDEAESQNRGRKAPKCARIADSILLRSR